MAEASFLLSFSSRRIEPLPFSARPKACTIVAEGSALGMEPQTRMRPEKGQTECIGASVDGVPFQRVRGAGGARPRGCPRLRWMQPFRLLWKTEACSQIRPMPVQPIGGGAGALRRGVCGPCAQAEKGRANQQFKICEYAGPTLGPTPLTLRRRSNDAKSWARL